MRFENRRIKLIEFSLPVFTTDTLIAMGAIEARNTKERKAPHAGFCNCKIRHEKIPFIIVC